MSRPKKKRTIGKLPAVRLFNPDPSLFPSSPVLLQYEELEALRLTEVEKLNQVKASQKMLISRPTFQRVLASARRKVARALVFGRPLRVQGGDWQISPVPASNS